MKYTDFLCETIGSKKGSEGVKYTASYQFDGEPMAGIMKVNSGSYQFVFSNEYFEGSTVIWVIPQGGEYFEVIGSTSGTHYELNAIDFYETGEYLYLPMPAENITINYSSQSPK